MYSDAIKSSLITMTVDADRSASGGVLAIRVLTKSSLSPDRRNAPDGRFVPGQTCSNLEASL